MKNLLSVLSPCFLFVSCVEENEKTIEERAEQGHAMAQYFLGRMYSQGKGVPQNDGEAVNWWRKAAEQGYAAAQYSLGNMYHFGNGVPKDDVKAYMFFNLASVSNDEAKEKRDEIGKSLTKEQIAEGQKLIREWLESKTKEEE